MFLESLQSIMGRLDVMTAKIDPKTKAVVPDTKDSNPLPNIPYVKKSDYIKTKYTEKELEFGIDDEDRNKYKVAKEEARKEIKARFEAVQASYINTMDEVLSLNSDNLPTTEEVTAAIKSANNVIKNHPERYPGLTPFKKTDYSLPQDKALEREAVQKAAKEAFAKNHTLTCLCKEILGEKLGDNLRETYAFIMSDVHNIDELLDDIDIVQYGTDAEKEKLVARKIEAAKKCMIELSESKGNDKAYIDYFNDNFHTVLFLGETDGTKVYQACTKLGLPAPKGAQKDFIDTHGTGGPSYSPMLNVLGKCMNPYYTKLDEDAYKAIGVITNGKVADDFADNDMHEKVITTIARPDYMTAKAVGGTCMNYLVTYGTDVSFADPKAYVPDYLKMYFLKNHNDFSKAVDEKGNVIPNDKDMIKKMTSGLIEGKTYVLYDKEGNYSTKVSIPNVEKSSTPTYSNGLLKNINFKLDPNLTIKTLKEEIKKLEGIFSNNHQEFTNIKKFVNNMDKAYQKGVTQAMLCEGLRDLASKYVESKAINCKYKKNARTLEREDFFSKLINNIDKAYPKEHIEVAPTNRIENLDKLSKKDEALLGNIIKMNKDGVAPNEVEAKVEEMLNEQNKTKISIEIENNIVEEKEPILENDAKEMVNDKALEN